MNMVQRISIIFSVSVITIISLFSNNLFGTTIAQLQTNSSGATPVQRVSFLTDDGVLIVGTYYYPASSHQTTPAKAIILLHMLGRDRNDWNGLASILSNSSNDHAVLSIDLRGHGESTSQNGKMISFQSFSLDDFNKIVLDVNAAKHFLVTQKHI